MRYTYFIYIIIGIALLVFAFLDGAYIAKQMVDNHREHKSAPTTLQQP